MEIKANCQIDFEAVKALTHLTMFKKANPKKRLAFWSIAFAILLVIIILEIIAFGMDSVLFVLLGAEIILLMLIYFWYFIIPKIQYKALAKMKNAQNEYIFTDEKIFAITKSAEYNGEAEIEYTLLARVYETTKYLFLYQTNNQVFIVDKLAVSGGTVEEIRGKLSSYLNNKYIICKY